jgi:sRNA-binding regulator protein Hfq
MRLEDVIGHLDKDFQFQFEVRIIVLNCGIELLSNVARIDYTIILMNPLMIVNPRKPSFNSIGASIMLHPYLPYSNETFIPISEDNIMLDTLANSHFISLYKEAISTYFPSYNETNKHNETEGNTLYTSILNEFDTDSLQ